MPNIGRNLPGLRTKPIRLAVLTIPGETPGGAEKLFDGLVEALNFDNVETDRIPIPVDERTFETIEQSYLNLWDLDLSRYDGVISTKAPSYMVRHPNHVCYLVHTMRVFYDMFETEFPEPAEERLRQRQFIQRMDTLAFQRLPPERLYCIGHEVRRRHELFNRCAFQVLHPGLKERSFGFQNANEPYAFLPGRLHRWKRVDLLIRAFHLTKRPLRLVIAGAGEDEAYFHSLAAGDERIMFVGRVSDEELAQCYSRARVVPFVPIREDFGYVTLEAFRSGKPVITCSDSGEPALFVRDGETGFVCPPDPTVLADKLDWMYDHPDQAEAMGQRAQGSVAHITWTAVRLQLLSALGF